MEVTPLVVLVVLVVVVDVVVVVIQEVLALAVRDMLEVLRQFLPVQTLRLVVVAELGVLVERHHQLATGLRGMADLATSPASVDHPMTMQMVEVVRVVWKVRAVVHMAAMAAAATQLDMALAAAAVIIVTRQVPATKASS